MIWLLLLSPILLVVAAWSIGGGLIWARAFIPSRRAAGRERDDQGAYRTRATSRTDPPMPAARSAWRTVVAHPVVLAIYAVAALLGGLLCSSYMRARGDAPRQCQESGRCSVGVAPLHQWLEVGVFEPMAASDEACRATAWCTAHAEAPPTAEGPLVRGVRNPPEGPVPEGCRAPCPLGGACSVMSGACGAKTDADCALTEACVLWGHCAAVRGTCVPVRDDDCEESRACRVLGRCRAIAGACRAPDHLAIHSGGYSMRHLNDRANDRALQSDLSRCRAAAPCLAEGACDIDEDGECVVGDDDDCRSSAACTARGACRRFVDGHRAECAASCADTTFCKQDGHCATMGEGLCGTGAALECEESEGCRLDGRCALVGGICQATAAICAAWEGCRFDGRCEVEAGVCRIARGSCERSVPCEKLGACSESTTFEGCGVGKQTDCAHSEVCEKYGFCSAIALGYWPMSTSPFMCFVRPRHEP